VAVSLGAKVRGNTNPSRKKASAGAVMSVMFKGAVPVFVIIRFWDKLPPTGTLPKSMDVGLS
jgi:hypothetical protein